MSIIPWPCCLQSMCCCGLAMSPITGSRGHVAPAAHASVGSKALVLHERRVLLSCLAGPEVSGAITMQVYSAPVHSASVNGVAFAPHELGLLLAAASSDGSLSVLAYQPDGTWAAEKARPVGSACLYPSRV